ncbi:dimethylaniline monooxygenase (N-oxide-forming) [Lentinus tigrinus ALCF2SS1-7]|uniref:Dimethylaniline monooxygenase (N-oxide-forming) n=1 Tax=Lentinus tigrinus ALCF2SS1-6 TaxID=1328759 RepID=A0A5C2RU82_9APHY|nr:dimethylaniline monooxygenase (N-oxide-forming) [Lentinus tigrinus ALCF2SS1-6]RPD70168.1 dimethylaniline monooxygenase (N-oxide-forming) [Lentinus tigrinus ALCF2SS1-7]
MSLDAHRVATEWLSALASALNSGVVSDVTTLFQPDGWLRDVLVLSWDLHTLEGRDKIAAYLSGSLKAGHWQITNVHLEDIQELAPRVCEVPVLPEASCVEFGFRFDLPHGHGRGVARLTQDSDGIFRALIVFLALHGLHGDNEQALGDDMEAMPGKECAGWVHQVESNPHVLVVGAGHSGLTVAARLKQMNIPSLVIEKNPRIGDNWRMRYPTLTLESIRRHCSLLFQPYPSTCPEFIPRDDIADWVERYVAAQDLVVWTDSALRPHPRYSDRTGKWDVTVIRAGVAVQLHPSHIVFATGLLGQPRIPAIAGLETFRGQQTHSESFSGGSQFSGKRAVVVGAANSSIDICQDLALKGAESVTMIQRSATCVQSRDYFNSGLKLVWREDEPLAVSDLKYAAVPLVFQEKVAAAHSQATGDAHKKIFDDLRRGGLNLADPGCNPYFMFLCRSGGFWIDKGGAELIGNGRIKVESGKSVDRFTETGLVLSDGTELLADVVVFATGYTSMRESNTDLLGPDIMQRVGPIGGLDEDGEIQGLFRPCGHPGLWFAGGDFFYPRFFSRQLGLLIKGADLGLLQRDSQPAE